jgi:hypothetical protein
MFKSCCRSPRFWITFFSLCLFMKMIKSSKKIRLVQSRIRFRFSCFYSFFCLLWMFVFPKIWLCSIHSLFMFNFMWIIIPRSWLSIW